MTKLTYILYDGTQTSDYAKALATGKPYTRRYEAVSEALPVDPIRRAKVLASIAKRAKNKI